MTTASVSTASLAGAPMIGVSRMQSNLVKLNQEVVTSRQADVGLALGARTAESVSLRINDDALGAMIDNNGLIASRLKQQQSALDSMRSGASTFIQAVTAAYTSGGDTTLVNTANSALASFTQAANASDGHNYLFGGVNSSAAPIAQYDSGPSAAITAAFTAKFGFPPTDPAAANITGAQMSDFLNNEFDALFADPAWGSSWSSASNTVINSRIDTATTVATSVSANEPAMRKLAEAYSAVASLGFNGLSDDAKKAILDKVSGLAGAGNDGVISIQGGLGIVQNQVTDATDRLRTQQSILQTRIGTLEGVDPTAAKVEIDQLTTQIEMSYSLTGKLLQISLLNYA